MDLSENAEIGELGWTIGPSGSALVCKSPSHTGNGLAERSEIGDTAACDLRLRCLVLLDSER